MHNRPLPDVTRLRILREVARHGSIAATARVVGISASAVSQQIALLEREANVSLIDRTSRGVALTGAGEALVGHADAVIALLEQTRAQIDQLSGAVAGAVRLGSIASAASAIVLPTAARLREEHPEVELIVSAAEPGVSLEQVVSGELDLAVIDRYDHVPVAIPDYLSCRDILTEPLELITAADLDLPAQPRLTDLKDLGWVMPPATAACGQAARFACREAGFEPRLHWETDDLLLLAEAIAAGQGVALLPRLAVTPAVAGLIRRPLRGVRLRRSILTVTRASNTKRPIIKAVLDELHALTPN